VTVKVRVQAATKLVNALIARDQASQVMAHLFIKQTANVAIAPANAISVAEQDVVLYARDQDGQGGDSDCDPYQTSLLIIRIWNFILGLRISIFGLRIISLPSN